MHEAWCYKPLSGRKVKCNLCILGCTIDTGKRGRCKTRENREGKLFNIIYGGLSSFSTDFIEKTPLYHFYPNHRFLTIGSAGCNLSCKFCLTWSITQKLVDELTLDFIAPARLLDSARELNCRGIVYTHSEPTLNIEFYSEIMEKAKSQGLLNVFATNGFISIEAFKRISHLLDAVALTYKGSKDFYTDICGVISEDAHFQDLVSEIKKNGIHLEVIYVLIPGVNDDRDSLEEVINFALKAEAPLIFLRFFPSYKMDDIESPTDKDLERALHTAYQMGLEHVYVENIFEHPGKNTYCPGCGSVLVERKGYGIVSWRVREGRCPICSYRVSISGEPYLVS